MQLVLLRRNTAQSVIGSATSTQPLGAMNSCFFLKKKARGSWEKREVYQDTQCLMQSVKLICMSLSNVCKGTLSLVC